MTNSTLRAFLLLLFSVCSLLFSEPPQLEPRDVNAKVNELLFTHINQKKLTPELLKRSIDNFINDLDPQKSYFTHSEIQAYLEPEDAVLDQTLEEFYKSNFSLFDDIYRKMHSAITRRNRFEKKLLKEELLTEVKGKEFEDMQWAENEEELYQRLLRIRSFQNDVAKKIEDHNFKSKFLAIAEKRRKWRESELVGKNTKEQSQILHAHLLKAIASSLDSHSMYFSPEEAKQFMMEVQLRLVGIGVQLIDDLTGFRIVSILEDGPAKSQGGLKEDDLIVAVDNEYVVGMDITQAVQLIRGKEHTSVKLTLLRNESEDAEPSKVEVKLKRGEVIVKESRLEAHLEPFAEGYIAHLTLHSFYQDAQSSCAGDLYNKISELKSKYHIKGVILDLRNNTGGILPQAVAVDGLFMGKGIVVSVKNYDGTIQHLRNIESNPIWDGPLVVLVNRLSASAAEIVAQSLQDYGRAIVVGDDRSFGKGTFQLTTMKFDADTVNPQGEYKVTQGVYYTVSGKTPQLVGVQSDICVPSYLCEAEVGEAYSKYPVENDQIPSNFEDRLDDIPAGQVDRVRRYYHFDLQQKSNEFTKYLDTLKTNASARIEENKDYQKLLEYLKEDSKHEHGFKGTENDHQLNETFNIMKDLIYLYEKDTSNRS